MRWCLCVIVGLASCLRPQARECTEDAECRLDGREGRCAPLGYCAYPNSECSSALSYSPYAPSDIAGRCVEGDRSQTGGEDTSTGPGCQEACGSVDVVELGRWSVDGDFFPTAAAQIDEERWSVVGERGDTTEALSLRADGVAWTVAATTHAWVAVASDSNGRTYLGGLDDDARPRVSARDTEGVELWSRGWSAAQGDTLAGLGGAAEGVIVAGTLHDRAWVEALSSDGTTRWNAGWSLEDEIVPQHVASRGSLVHLVGATSDGGTLALRTLSGIGGALDASSPLAEALVQSVVDVDASRMSLALAGNDAGGWLRRYSFEGGSASTLLVDDAVDVRVANLDSGHTLLFQRRAEAPYLRIDGFDAAGIQLDTTDVETGPLGGLAVIATETESIVFASESGALVAWEVTP